MHLCSFETNGPAQDIAVSNNNPDHALTGFAIGYNSPDTAFAGIATGHSHLAAAVSDTT